MDVPLGRAGGRLPARHPRRDGASGGRCRGRGDERARSRDAAGLREGPRRRRARAGRHLPRRAVRPRLRCDGRRGVALRPRRPQGHGGPHAPGLRRRARRSLHEGTTGARARRRPLERLGLARPPRRCAARAARPRPHGHRVRATRAAGALPPPVGRAHPPGTSPHAALAPLLRAHRATGAGRRRVGRHRGAAHRARRGQRLLPGGAAALRGRRGRRAARHGPRRRAGAPRLALPRRAAGAARGLGLRRELLAGRRRDAARRARPHLGGARRARRALRPGGAGPRVELALPRRGGVPLPPRPGARGRLRDAHRRRPRARPPARGRVVGGRGGVRPARAREPLGARGAPQPRGAMPRRRRGGGPRGGQWRGGARARRAGRAAPRERGRRGPPRFAPAVAGRGLRAEGELRGRRAVGPRSDGATAARRRRLVARGDLRDDRDRPLRRPGVARRGGAAARRGDRLRGRAPPARRPGSRVPRVRALPLRLHRPRRRPDRRPRATVRVAAGERPAHRRIRAHGLRGARGLHRGPVPARPRGNGGAGHRAPGQQPPLRRALFGHRGGQPGHARSVRTDRALRRRLPRALRRDRRGAPARAGADGARSTG